MLSEVLQYFSMFSRFSRGEIQPIHVVAGLLLAALVVVVIFGIVETELKESADIAMKLTDTG